MVGSDVGLPNVVLVRDGVKIDGFDAIKALSIFGRADAARYWREELAGDPFTVTGYTSLIFQASEGPYLPMRDMLAQLPGIETFDEVDREVDSL